MVKDYREPLVMGVLNVTPDSFSDGGRFLMKETAVAHAAKMIAAGADIIDVGGESTRPGSEGISVAKELDRVMPVIEEIHQNLSVEISVDTTKPAVARAALQAGASIINDVSMLRNGSELAEIAAEYSASIVIMHSRKTPRDMQRTIHYDDVTTEVRDELLEAVSVAKKCGVAEDQIWLDPGIGFAKTAAQNLTLMSRLHVLAESGFPVLVGPSRKSFIGEYTGATADERVGGTAAAVAISIYNGASAVRVHDIEIMKQATIISAKLREMAENR